MRSLFKQWMEQIFLESSFLIFPGTVSAAPQTELFSTNSSVIEKSSWVDNLLLLANFNGSPSLNLPLGTEKELPVSLNIDAPWGADKVLLEFAEVFLAADTKKHP